ncbi:MAG: bifunctional diaminohydroxyphosphoribosylaminopyrimidine deaminase/5-amino-6-(5-phosphoribosylamino)uracil reductase RibD [Firmicutes bacterium]|nr:bifunctional diaminohydroxyphosphoribosylaminopyrimidine deaminase/5-amino-6-(5-phosphoribosylamino)uracil reductase RibD [Bacillota bacterium]
MVDDEKYMAMALELAAHAKGNTSPNPMVGAVLVKNGKIIGTGFHPRAGEPHAEVFALDAAGKAAVGATLYVSLEPCSHTGKTPPCTQRIIAAGVREVVVAMQDPNPLVNGQGLLQLATAGMITRSGVLQLQAQRLNEVFIKHITTERPFVTMKAAMTLDGKIATRTKASRWITNERSREFAHRLRHENDAIMVGIGTVLADNPSLTTRLPEDGRNALRIIVDSRAQTPITATVVQNNPENTILMVTDAADFQRVNRLQQEGVDVRVFPADEQGRVPATCTADFF